MRSRLLLLMGLALLGGCNSSEFALTSNLDVPVLLGPAQALGGKPLAADLIDEDYQLEVNFRGEQLEEGRGNLFQRTGVVNGELYVGRYAGLLVFVPVSNHWIGVEGEIAQVGAPGSPR